MKLSEVKERLIQKLGVYGIKDKKVLDAIFKTKRELFVPDDFKQQAYLNTPLPISNAQTISQPYTVARMIELLELKLNHKILEIGGGSGYNAAVMSILIGKKGKIYSTELEKTLCDFAKANLEKAKIKNVKIIHSDGSRGYKMEAPYDRIIVTCAAKEIPPPLIAQLKPNGIIVIPISRPDGYGQTMTKIIKTKQKEERPKTPKLKITKHGDFSFVPLRHK
jgi:protein-L-isoaspartate(D-aspartate) O-methyltransferase